VLRPTLRDIVARAFVMGVDFATSPATFVISHELLDRAFAQTCKIFGVPALLLFGRTT
jgi:hypothetical protein